MTADPPITAPMSREVLRLARVAIESRLKGEPEPALDPGWHCRTLLQLYRGVFVTLEKKGRLRGCIGELDKRFPLHRGIRICSVKAALEDPRFAPVTMEELPSLCVSVSIIGQPQAIVEEGVERATALVPHRDGVILLVSGQRSTFLPRVWQQYEDPRDFLTQLCLKQGASPDRWTDPAVELFRYEATEIKEFTPPGAAV